MEIMKHYSARIVSNSLCCEDMYEMQFTAHGVEIAPLPGQFCTIRVSQTTSPLLRRPFAISDFDVKTMITSMVYKKCGLATEILTGKNPGDPLDVIAPLGNSFTGFKQGANNILVAGGTGFGPILFWNKYLHGLGEKPVMVLGCRFKAQLPALAGAASPAAVLCTDDGSAGFKGTVVEYLRTLKTGLLDKAALYCCGQTPMLKACHEFALEKNIECYVSLSRSWHAAWGRAWGAP